MNNYCLNSTCTDIIEFEAVEYICYETDEFIELTVIRKGSILDPIGLQWSTVDIAAGRSFKPLCGEIVFNKNETVKKFKLDVIWTFNEFSVESLVDVALSFQHSYDHSQTLLGDNLLLLLDKYKDVQSTRIVFLNFDQFPSGVDTTRESDNAVIFGFLTHNHKLFSSKVKFGILLKLIPGFTFVASQFILQYLLKTVTIAYSMKQEHEKIKDNFELITFLFGGAYLLNMFLSYISELLFCRLKLGGCVALSLRSMCVDTVIQLTAVEVEEFDVGRVIKTTDGDVETAIKKSWLACFTFCGHGIKILFMYFFLCYTLNDQAKLSATPEINMLILIPTCLILMEVFLLLVSFRRGSDKNKVAMDADDAWSSFLAQVSCLRQTITNYRKGFKVTDEFESIHRNYNDKAYAAALYSLNVQWLANFIPSVATAIIMVLVARRVINKEITLPAFVVFLNTMNQLGPTLSAVFMDVFHINKGYASIVRIANLLNSDTRRKRLHRIKKRREALIAEYRQKPEAEDWNDDDIVVHNVSYFFPSRPSSIILSRVSFRMQAGQVMAIGGAASVGKKCMLKLLARHYSPINEGFIHYPANWRVRFLDSNTHFFGGDNHKLFRAKLKGKEKLLEALKNSTGTLIYNLKFGCDYAVLDENEFEKEIYQLLKLLGLSEHLIGRNVDDFITGNQAKKYTNIGLNGEKLSQTDQTLLNIACALLSSVDLLLISNLLDVLGPKHGSEIMLVLKQFVENRGMTTVLRSDPNSAIPFQLRKRKTIVFSTKILSLQQLADNWIYFDDM